MGLFVAIRASDKTLLAVGYFAGIDDGRGKLTTYVDGTNSVDTKAYFRLAVLDANLENPAECRAAGRRPWPITRPTK